MNHFADRSSIFFFNCTINIKGLKEEIEEEKSSARTLYCGIFTYLKNDEFTQK